MTKNEKTQEHYIFTVESSADVRSQAQSRLEWRSQRNRAKGGWEDYVAMETGMRV